MVELVVQGAAHYCMADLPPQHLQDANDSIAQTIKICKKLCVQLLGQDSPSNPAGPMVAQRARESLTDMSKELEKFETRLWKTRSETSRAEMEEVLTKAARQLTKVLTTEKELRAMVRAS